MTELNQSILPKRGPTHVTDTRAVRLVIGQLDDNWLVRSLEERDYGIDLQLELFDGDNPTGRIIFVQVKGTDGTFSENEDEKFSLPTKTIRYAKLFNAPFFLFYVSNASKEVRFVWLQKYAETRLLRDSKNWNEQDSVTVYLPAENTLSGAKEKISKFAEKQANETVGLEFLRVESNLVLHAPNVVNNDEFKVGYFCAEEARKLFGFAHFFKPFIFTDDHEQGFTKLASLPGCFETIALGECVTKEQKRLVMDSLALLSEVKVSFLATPDLDSFAEEQGIVLPY